MINNNWISVKDNLPPVGTAVLAIIKYATPDSWFTYALLCIDIDNKWHHFWNDTDGLAPEYQVTHWTQVPDPPEKIIC